MFVNLISVKSLTQLRGRYVMVSIILTLTIYSKNDFIIIINTSGKGPSGKKMFINCFRSPTSTCATENLNEVYCPHSGQGWQQNNGHLPRPLLIYLGEGHKKDSSPFEEWGGPLCHPELNEDSSHQGNILPLLLFGDQFIF